VHLNSIFRPFLALALVILAAVSLLAQDPVQRSQDVIRSRADLVTADVTVRDRAGRFVPDLASSDFEILEDGVPQKLVTLIMTQGGRVYTRLTNAPPPGPGAGGTEGIVLPPPAPAADTSGRIFVIFVDDLHLAARDTPRIRARFRDIANELIHDGDMFAMVSTGTSSIEIGLTRDRKRLDDAITRITGGALSPSEIMAMPVGADGPAEVRHHVHVAFRTAYDMMRELEKVQGRRKAFIYVSNGYDLNPFAGGRARSEAEWRGSTGAEPAGDPFRSSGQFAEADLAAQLGELTRAANRANATIYTIDPRGLVAGPDLDQRVDIVEWQQHITSTQNSLRVLADLTGGFAIVNRNNITASLKRIDAETSDYYVLGYYSSNADPTVRRRRIEVRVRRPALEVMSRTEYYLPRR
jgi:VWFA-related protein